MAYNYMSYIRKFAPKHSQFALINPKPTEYDNLFDFVIHGDLNEVLKELTYYIEAARDPLQLMRNKN